MYCVLLCTSSVQRGHYGLARSDGVLLLLLAAVSCSCWYKCCLKLTRCWRSCRQHFDIDVVHDDISLGGNGAILTASTLLVLALKVSVALAVQSYTWQVRNNLRIWLN